MNPREINDPLPVLGKKIEPVKPPAADKMWRHSETNPSVIIMPDGKMETIIPENQRAKYDYWSKPRG